MHEAAFAKLNLALHVRGREPDGYHRIETVFVFVEDGDRLGVTHGDALTLDLQGPFAGQLSQAEDNLVLRAAELLRLRFDVARGASLTLAKNLPVAAGLGGGSADAAAALRLLVRFWQLAVAPGELMELAGMLGADVPACLLSVPARGEGRGDVLAPIDDPSWGAMPVLLVHPARALATADVFRSWDGRDRGPLGDPFAGRNDLEAPARALVPEIGDVLEALRGSGNARLVRMSGSGGTCFALYDDEAARNAARDAIAQKHPGWWLLASRLRSG